MMLQGFSHQNQSGKRASQSFPINQLLGEVMGMEQEPVDHSVWRRSSHLQCFEPFWAPII